MKNGSLKFWLGGTLVSMVGVLLARVIAPGFTDRPTLLIATYLTGVTLGIAGLVIFTFGAGQAGREDKIKAEPVKEVSS